MKKQIVTVIAITLFSFALQAQVKVLSNGNVGIGITNPANKLVVQNSTTLHSTLYNTSGNFIYRQSMQWVLNNVNGTGTGFSLGIDGTGNGSIFKGTPSSAANIMSFSYAGNFCIGNWPSTDYKFRLYNTGSNSSFYCEKTSGTAWSYNMISKVYGADVKAFVVNYNGDKIYMYGNGNIYASNFIQTSDMTLKENINDISSPLAKLLNLHGVTYNFKPETLLNPSDTLTIISTATPKTEIGVLAQEVEQIVPEAVWTNENGIKGVNYGSLIGLLIEAFKEQNATITLQQQEIEALKARLDNCCPVTPGSINH